MDGKVAATEPFAELDRAPAPEAWWPDLSDSLLKLGASIVPVDRPILARLFAFLAQHSASLHDQAAKHAPVAPPKEITKSNPGSATLFRYRHSRAAGLERLLGIGLCSLLEASGDGRNHPKQLLTMMRGALESPNSPLTGALGAVSSITELIRAVDSDIPTRSGLPPQFLQLWETWLRDTLVRWMLTEPGRLRHALEPKLLLPQPDDPQIPVSLDSGEVEGGITLSSTSTSADDQPLESTPCRVGRAASQQLDRASISDLLSAADLRLPSSIDERLCRSAVSRGKEYLEQDVGRAEPFVALALSLGGGIREIDLRDVVWGGENEAHPHSVDPDHPILFRRIKRPPHAVNPRKELAQWLEPTSDVLAWPLAPSVHALLVKLGRDARKGEAVLPRLGVSLSRPYRLRDVVDQLVPEAKVGALAPRQALASRIAASLGTEMAQLSMADTFGMPSVPAYYSALPEMVLAQCIAHVQSQRFGELVEAPSDRPGFVGSRLVVTRDAAKRWPTLLRAAQKSARRQPDDWLGQWKADRDHLAAALCSATGHRPEDALGKIFLSDVIPEYGIIILRDKQVDVLRATRVAATGRLWLSHLRRFLDRLIDIATTHPGAPEGDLAEAILGCNQPLFRIPVPGGDTEDMTAAALRNGMPEDFWSIDNFYRHRLNQWLQGAQVDPEVRHAQLGWVVSAAHLHADMSPRSSVDLGSILAPVIDDLMVADGWYLPSARKTRWTWERIPLPPPVDWDVAFAAHKKQADDQLKTIRKALNERWKNLEGPVLSRLARAFQELCPLLHIDVEHKRLEPTHAGQTVELREDHHGLICEKVRQGDEDPASGLEVVMTRILLYRLVRRARDRSLVRGPIPSRPYLTTTAESSPFVPGLGIAIRRAHLIRAALLSKAESRKIRDLGPLTVWSILAFSIYRQLPWARAALHASSGTDELPRRAAARSNVVRVDARVEEGRIHMVLGGAPAILFMRRKQLAPTSPLPKIEALESWAMKHLSDGLDWSDQRQVSRQIQRTLMAAAHIELSGIERCLLQSAAQTAAGTIDRCVARDDGWPVRTALVLPARKPSSAPTPPVEENAKVVAMRSLRQSYDQLASLLNKRSFGRLRASKASKHQRASDARRGWRTALGIELKRYRLQVDSNANLAILADYAADHLRYGSEDGHRLAQASLQREITLFGWPLLVLLEGRNLLNLSTTERLGLYRALVLSKPVKSRPFVVEELGRFQRFLLRVHACPAVDFAELAAIAGPRQLDIDPGLLTEAECDAVFGELHRDEANERERPDASPEFIRLAQLRQVFFLILQASGIRPGSAYGLTLSDVHLLGEAGDFVHIRTSEYGEAKTRTSLGFVPLEGTLWEKYREWIQGWIREQQAILPDNWLDLPLFALQPGSRQRVHEYHLSNRINVLLRWVTGMREAHSYWLRKTRITERFHKLSRTGSTARHVHEVLAASGHAWIQTTIDHYINDPACLLFADAKAANDAPRALLLATSGLDPALLDTAWNRAERDEGARTSVVLDRLGVKFYETPDELRTPVPTLGRFKPLCPAHIDTYARAMQRQQSQSMAVLEAGITLKQAGILDEIASDLLIRRGQTPWNVATNVRGRLILAPARKLAGTEGVFALLEDKPTAAIELLVEAWAMQSHVERIYGDNVIMRLDTTQAPTCIERLIDNGLKVRLDNAKGPYTLLMGLPDTEHMGHSSALRWAFSILWIYLHAFKTTARTSAVQ